VVRLSGSWNPQTEKSRTLIVIDLLGEVELAVGAKIVR